MGGVRSLGEAATAADKAGTEASFLAVDMDPGESQETIEEFMEYVDAEHVPAAIDTGAALSSDSAWLRCPRSSWSTPTAT